MLTKKEWFNKNQELLEFLFYELIRIASTNYSIQIFNDNKSIQNFINMMYNSSTHSYVLPYSSYPDFLLNK